MRKILLASSALVLTAGLAHAQAEITLGGDGYMGLAFGEFDGDGIFTTTSDAECSDAGAITDRDECSSYAFVFDLDFDITAAGESDGGLVFGASMDIDEMDTSQGALGYDSVLFVSGAFGQLSMGDTDGGAEAIIGDLDGVGITGLGDFNENIFLIGAGAPPAGPLALYEFSSGGLSLALGFDDDEGYSAAVGYDGGIWAVGLGYEAIREGATITLFDIDAIGSATGSGTAIDITASDDVEHIIGAASVNFEGFTLKGTYGQADTGDVDIDQYGISAGYGLDAWDFTAYYRKIETDGLDDDGEADFFGVGVSYDLGGGLALGGGIANADVDGADGDLTIADLGFTFAF